MLSLVIMGCVMTTTVSAVQPPFRPPEFPWPSGEEINPGTNDNVIYQSDASFIVRFWTYYVDETEPVDELELFPEPIRVQVWFQSPSGDVCEIKLSRSVIGNGLNAPPPFVGPTYLWYVYFEPYHFEPGVYRTLVWYTCKNPDNPSERMTVWNTEPGPGYGVPLRFFGSLTVLAG